MDSEAFDHMTVDATILDNYNPCNENLIVYIVDGSLSKVDGTGSVILSKDPILTFVPLVPDLDCNVLSINKLNKKVDL